MALSWTYRNLGQGGSSNTIIRDWCRRSNGDVYCTGPTFLAYTGDSGSSWSITGTDLGFPSVSLYASLVSNDSGGVMVGGSRDNPGEIIIRRSTNGTTWDYKDDFDLPNAFLSFREISSYLWSVANNGTNPTGRIYYTSNFGDSWSYKSVPWPQNFDVAYLDGYMYVAGDYGTPRVNRSNNLGDSWSGDIVTGLASGSGIRKLAVFQGNLYAATEDGYVYKFNAGTLTWSSVFSSLTCSYYIRVIQDELWVVGDGAGDKVWRSSDGTNWYGQGFSSYLVSSIFYDEVLNVVYLGCSYNRVYTSNIPQILPPIRSYIIPKTNANDINFERGVPNDYFDDLSKWDHYPYLGSETAIVSSNKFKQDVVDSTSGKIRSVYRYNLPPSGNCNFFIDLTDYAYDNSSNPPYAYVFFQSKSDDGYNSLDNVYLQYRYNGSTHYVQGGYKEDGGSPVGGTIYNPAGRPSIIQLYRIGSEIRIYYFQGGSWTQVLSHDFGFDKIYSINEICLGLNSVNSRGGYVEWANCLNVSYNCQFFKEFCNGLNNFKVVSGVNYTVSENNGVIRLDGDDSIGAYVNLAHKISNSNNYNYVEVDLVNYVPDNPGTDDALQAIFKLSDMSETYSVYITYANKAAGHRAWLVYVPIGGVPVVGSELALTSQPTKLRIARVAQIFTASVYTDAWYEVDEITFGTNSGLLMVITLGISSSNNRGGYAEFDNIVCENSPTSYNLYWKKDKCPNCYFHNIYNWTAYKLLGSESYSINNDVMKLDVPTNGDIKLVYNFSIQPGDFISEVDIPIFIPDTGLNSIVADFMIMDEYGVYNDTIQIRYYLDESSNHTVESLSLVNSVLDTDIDYPSDRPTKFRIERVGTILNTYYYISDWTLAYSKDFSTRSDNLKDIRLRSMKSVTSGGIVGFDNLIITPSVKDDYDGVVNDIVDLTYNHTSLDGDSVYCYELTSQGSESEPTEEIYGIPEMLGIPYNLNTISGSNQNIITFQHGCPNDYFDNLDNWTVTKNTDNETATIVDGKLHIDLPDWEAGDLRAFYDYELPNCDFEVIIDIPTFVPDEPTSAFIPWLRLFDNTDYKNHAGMYYSLTALGESRIQGRLRVNNVAQDSVTGSLGSRPTKFKISRSGTTFYLYYYISSWTLADSRDFGLYASLVRSLQLIVQSNSSRGGYVEYDNLCIIPTNNYFQNDTFNSLDRWSQSTSNGTISLVNGAVRLDVIDSQDGSASLRNIYSISQGDFTLDVDLIDYFADAEGTSDALECFLGIDSNNYDNRFYIYYNHESNYVSHIAYKYNGGSITHNIDINIGSEPSKLRIRRVGNTLYGYVYIDTWILIGQYDFNTFSSELCVPSLYAIDVNNRGGYVDFDNLTYNFGANSYNLYWKKDKHPNCYFNNGNNWTDFVTSGTVSGIFTNGQLVLDLADGEDNAISTYNIHRFPSGDFVATIDIVDYSPDSSVESFVMGFRVVNYSETNAMMIRYDVNSGTKRFKTTTKINDVQTDYIDTPTYEPTKFRIERVGTYLKTYGYINGAWILFRNIDFGSYASDIDRCRINVADKANRGGSVTYDNLIITPSVKDDYDGVINNIIDLSYIHQSLEGASVYCYELTAQGSESEPSEETYGLTVPDTPTNIVVIPDVEENNISWDAVTGADQYNLYWMLYEYYNELFSTDLSDWDIYKGTGTETIEIQSGKLYCYTSTATGGNYNVVRKTLIPSGDFQIDIDFVTYVPGYNNPGYLAYFRIVDSYPTGNDRADIYYQLTDSGTVHHVHVETYINGSYTDTDTVVAGKPTKFKIKREGNQVNFYCYITSWVLLKSSDYGVYAANLDTVVFTGIKQGGYGGVAEWDNLTYWVDVQSRGTKIADVTSSYEHSSLTPNLNYIYVLTAENSSGESEETSIYNGVPLVGTPSPPSGISTEGGEGQNTITFTVDPEADETHIYWSNSPGVSPETGTKIEDVSSPYIQDDLNPSLTYYYVLTSENIYGEGVASAEYNDSPYPEPPENIDVEEGIEKNTLTWDDSFGADSYNLYWRNEAGVTKVNSTKITGVTSPYSHSGLTPGLDYFYALAAEDEDGESSLSSEVSGVPNLAAPGSPEADLSGALEITVTWNPVVGAIRYNLYWDKSPGVTVETGNKIVDVTSPYIHTDLDDGDTYYYIITAENAVEEGIPSVEVSAVVGDAPIPPANVAAVSTDIQEITVSWSSVSGAESYNIYYGVFNGINKIVGTKIEDVTSPYVFDAPIPDIQYYFLVTAVDDVTGEGDESEVVNALSIPPIPDAPTDVVATPGEAKITLDFTVAPYADTHHIYWSTTPGVTQLTGTKIADVSTGYEFIVPELYISYYFIITAENESGESVDSVEVNAIPIPVIPNIPENVEGEPTASGELTISWDVALYAETYNVYYSRLPNVDKVSASKIEGFGDVEAILSELIAGRFYYFAVSAVNPEGESELSEEAFVRVINSLSGQQIFYIKAESEKNGVIVSWSELEYADSYNLYWSKNTPVDTTTANKIENVSSPYRHYRLSTDDPYYVVTGENILGESDPSSEANADPDATDFQSINFLPENLHEYPLFQEFCNIVDYVVAKYHYENVDKLTGLYDAVHSDFDPNYVLKLLGSDYFLQFDLNDDQKKALCLLLSNLYDMKGTKKGLDYVLRLMGLDAQVYEWYNINQGLYPEIPEIVDPCSIVIDLGLGDHSLSDETEQQFLNLASYLLWVCVKLHGIFWSKKFEDWFEGIEDELITIEIDNSIYDKFCSYMYNYPETVIIGSPVMGSITFVGESGLTIGATYFEGYPFLISPDLEGGADTDGVCQPHFIGEPDIYIGGGDISQLSWIIEED